MSHRQVNDKEKIWEIVTGCTEISLGCDSCPPLVAAHKRGEDFKVCYWHGKLNEPLERIAPTSYMVAHGSDLFHDAVETTFILEAFEVMGNAERHTFQIVTKRVDRLMYLSEQLKFHKNIALGVGVTTKADVWKIKAIKDLKCDLKYVSAVPLLGYLGEMRLEGIKHFGVSEESWGPCRKVNMGWVEDIERQCREQNVSFAFDEAVLA